MPKATTSTWDTRDSATKARDAGIYDGWHEERFFAAYSRASGAADGLAAEYAEHADDYAEGVAEGRKLFAGGLEMTGEPRRDQTSERGPVTDVHKITTLDEAWLPGDVVFDAQGDIWGRSDHVKWVWSHAPGSTRDRRGGALVPDGSVEEHVPARPLLLLVRDGQAVTAATRAPRPGQVIGTYTGHLPEDTFIADETCPWIEIDNVAVVWPLAQLSPDPTNECEACAGEPLPGVLTDPEVGVQSCDTCQRFDGDLPAALALAARLGGVVKYEQVHRD